MEPPGPQGQAWWPVALPISRIVCGAGVSCEALLEPRGDRGLLLLHGYSFRYTVWLEAGADRLAEELGVGLAAPDMPYGRSTSCTRRTRDLELNTRCARRAAEEAGIAEAIVVAASMGARYALVLATQWPGARALLLIGPALGRSPQPFLEAAEKLRERGVPATVLRGASDRVVSRRAAAMLAEALGAEYRESEGGHVLHRDNPEAFHQAVRDLAEKTWRRRA